MNRTAPDHQADFSQKRIKVFIRLKPADWHNYKTESVWAEPLGGDLYRIRNVPFCAMGLSQDDVVRASLVDGCLFLDEVLRRGGALNLPFHYHGWDHRGSVAALLACP